MGEVLIQVWLKSGVVIGMHKKSLKKLPRFTQAPTSPHKMCNVEEKTGA